MKAITSIRSQLNIAAIEQLLEWRDKRLIPALEEIARRPEMERVRADIEETIMLVRERLGIPRLARNSRRPAK